MKYLKRLPLLAVLLAVPLLMAPARRPDPYANIGNFNFQVEIDGIDVSGEVQRRFVQREDDYYLGLSVMIVNDQGVLVTELYHVHPIIPRGDLTTNKGLLVEIAPALVPWDRNGGTFSGTAAVCVMAQIFDRNGRPVKNTYAKTCGVVEIR